MFMNCNSFPVPVVTKSCRSNASSPVGRLLWELLIIVLVGQQRRDIHIASLVLSIAHDGWQNIIPAMYSLNQSYFS